MRPPTRAVDGFGAGGGGGEVEGASTPNLPAGVCRTFEWIWTQATSTKLGAGVAAMVIYVIPYGLAVVAIGSQIRSGGDYELLVTLALIAVTFASAQPAPTPVLGTLALVLVGFMGAFFDPIVVGLLAAVAGLIGLLVSYGVGAAGIGQLLVDRMSGRPKAAAVIDRAFDVTRRRGPWAILALTAVPNPLYAWSSVAAGASGTRFSAYVAAALSGSAARFVAVAFIGVGILALVN